MSPAPARCVVCGDPNARPLFEKDRLSYRACRDCGAVFAWPQPPVEEQAARYRAAYSDAGQVYRDYDSFASMKRRNFEPRLRLLETWQPERGRLLDVGCATGIFVELAQERGWDVRGIDVSPAAAEQTARRIGPERVHCGELDDRPFEGTTFDAVTLFDCLEHVRDPRRTLEHVARRLAPGGVLVITTPDLDKLSRRLLGRFWPHFQWEHLVLFSRGSLARAVRAAGFAVCESLDDRKIVNAGYVLTQLRMHAPRPVAAVCGVLLRAAPARALDRCFSMSVGQQVLMARRLAPDSTGTS